MISEEKNIYVGVITITCTAPKSSGIQKQKYKVGYVSTTDSKKQRDEAVALKNSSKRMLKYCPTYP